MPNNQPKKVSIRTYNVGFGDCFLLTFRYSQPHQDQHILIDFGSTKRPPNSTSSHMENIANDIKKKCNNKLAAIVATHRHRDHISGFKTKKDGKGSGDIIRACKPDVVLLPWTEHPYAERNALKPPKIIFDNTQAIRSIRPKENDSIAMMQSYISYAVNLQKKSKGARNLFTVRTWEEIGAVGTTNMTNMNAVKNLATMAQKNFYIHFGSQSGLEEILPGVKVHVLGPPTLEQSEGTTLRQRGKHDDEFWPLQAMASRAKDSRFSLFPGAKKTSDQGLIDQRWFIEQAKNTYSSQLLEFVRSVDKAINNTSIILLFECNGKKLLFSGDAQLENWLYVLKQDEIKELLKDVDVYKIGHHGSTNATPQTLWKLFRKKKSLVGDKKSLRSINSTMPEHHHGVPRESLVEEFKSETTYFTTEAIADGKLSTVHHIKFDS